MAGICEAILALIGLVTVLVIGLLWLLEHADDASPDDAVRRISRAAYEAHMRMAEEELRRRAAQWGTNNTPPMNPWRGRR